MILLLKYCTGSHWKDNNTLLAFPSVYVETKLWLNVHEAQLSWRAAMVWSTRQHRALQAEGSIAR